MTLVNCVNQDQLDKPSWVRHVQWVQLSSFGECELTRGAVERSE
jgi:hypothetical protein